MPSPVPFYVNQINKGLPQAAKSVRAIRKHLQLLAKLLGASPVIDERQCSKIAITALKDIEKIEKQVNNLEGLSKKIRRKDLGDQYGPFMSNMNGQLKQFDKEVKGFGGDLKALKMAIDDIVKSPTRSGMGAAADPVSQLMKACIVLLRITLMAYDKLKKAK